MNPRDPRRPGRAAQDHRRCGAGRARPRHRRIAGNGHCRAAPQSRARRLCDKPCPASGQEGRCQSARAGRLAGRGAVRRRGHRIGRRRRARLRQSADRSLGPGRHRQQRHRCGPALRPLRSTQRSEGQPGVRIGQSHRAHPHRRHPMGRGRRRAGPSAVDAGRGSRARILLQRPWRPDRPVHQLTGRRRQGRTHAGRRLCRQLHRRHRCPDPGQGARRAEPARRRDARDVPLHRRRPDVHPYQGFAA